jgi:hypothetical protein
MKPARIASVLKWQQCIPFLKYCYFGVSLLRHEPCGERQAGKPSPDDGDLARLAYAATRNDTVNHPRFNQSPSQIESADLLAENSNAAVERANVIDWLLTNPTASDNLLRRHALPRCLPSAYPVGMTKFD